MTHTGLSLGLGTLSLWFWGVTRDREKMRCAARLGPCAATHLTAHLRHHLVQLASQAAILTAQLLVLAEGGAEPGLKPLQILFLLAT